MKKENKMKISIQNQTEKTENSKKTKMNKHFVMIACQLAFLAIVLSMIYFLYPRADMSLEGNVIRIDSGNANLIILSENPDFSNPRYLEINENISLTLKPGTYYWKTSNNYIEGISRKFSIDSEVGLKIDNESSLVNIGNVKINVSRTKEGVMLGHIILEPNESEEIENSGEYTGGQDGK